MNKFIVRRLILISIFSLIFISFGGVKVHAAATVDPCDIEKTAYDPGKWWFDIDIRRTMSNMIVSMGSAGFASTAGVNMTTAARCESYVLQYVRVPQLGYKGTMCPADPGTTNECNQLLQGSSRVTGYDDNTPSSLAINGSLLGLTNKLENVTKREPLMLNLAYYWNDQISHVPFVSKTFAATIYDEMPIIQATLSLWKVVRNISLAFISIILLYTGIMIILRKKVNPQLVVSVQYAIPQILIGLVLIIFSYPIGATITGVTWALFRGAETMVLNLMTAAGSGSVLSGLKDNVNLSSLAFMAITITGLKNAGAGVGLVVLGIVTTIVMYVLKLVLQLKAIIIYIKMVMSTLTAPFEFALGTVPGNEDKVKDWFTRMAKYALTIFAMGVAIPVTLLIALEIVLQYANYSPVTGGNLRVETAGFGSIMTIITPMIIIIFGFSLAIGMENTIDKMFFGGDKKRK